ncbi:solute carrier family 19 member 3b [Chiloscyllium plagiosum]|uniref:solute carrier family 19 member 3b n=1 Tax=Chiloscyllium plagiosum TaxID=36176 RepID=UPI001CB7B526|nr:solute carrier family 19 member 3b [Chiloscyllium plagiosum]
MDCWKTVRDKKWVYPTLVLCTYGFFATMKPAEPFLTPYLVGPYKNFTIDQVTNQLFPIWTYSFLALLIPVFLFTDYLRYKPVIIIQGVALVINYILLLFADGMMAMHYLQFNNGLVSATEVAYYSYIYSVVDAEHYQKVTSYCRSITLTAYTVGSTMAQLLVSLDIVSYFDLNVISLGSVTVALVTSFLLPMPRQSIFFQSSDKSSNDSIKSNISNGCMNFKKNMQGSTEKSFFSEQKWLTHWLNIKEKNTFLKMILQLWSDFKNCYSSRNLLYWSFWWAIATCGYYQIFNYVQVLWDHIAPSKNVSVYNGGVEALTTLTGAITSFGVGYITLDWAVWGELVLGIFSGVSSAALFIMDTTNNIWVCYVGYMIFKASYMLLITITTFHIASNLCMERYALLFGVNNCMALILQTILTIVVVDSSGLGLDVVTQFLIYGSLYALIAGIFLLKGVHTFIQHRLRSKRRNLKEDFPSITLDPPTQQMCMSTKL